MVMNQHRRRLAAPRYVSCGQYSASMFQKEVGAVQVAEREKGCARSAEAASVAQRGAKGGKKVRRRRWRALRRRGGQQCGRHAGRTGDRTLAFSVIFYGGAQSTTTVRNAANKSDEASPFFSDFFSGANGRSKRCCQRRPVFHPQIHNPPA